MDTNANFTNAKLINSDFRGAHLTDTCWEGVEKLYLAQSDKFKVPKKLFF
ncbi:MAG: pentapeptide repeat-containing protein [Moorea sp. SIO2B7]|nr:pentapeptide repeat-containing protein [Moorena sp. SIO2B7]